VTDREARRLDERIDATDRLFGQMFADRDERVVIALQSIERRLDLLNEFRRQSADESARFATREVVDTAMGSMSGRIAENASAISRLQGRALALAGVGSVVGAVVTALLLGVIG